jgi:uncharacterized membrane protein (UPF0127 family)
MLIKIKNLVLNVHVAKKISEQQLGLQHVDYLPKNYGMLFEYDKNTTETFHMHNVYFPLDIIGIDSNKKINQICLANPGDERIVLDNILYVLEVRKDLMKENDIEIGDQIEFVKNSSLLDQPSYTLVEQPLIERRDYVPHGFDILEQNAIALKKKKKLPEEIEIEMRERMKGIK